MSTSKCPYCDGDGWVGFTIERDKSQTKIMCMDCDGEGVRCSFCQQSLAECKESGCDRSKPVYDKT